MPVVSAWVAAACVCLGAEPAVSVEGGSGEDGHSYAWTVRNNAAQAITYIEFPHYNGDLPTDVRGWKPEMTEQVGAGGGGRVGKLMYTAEAPFRGLAPGRSETFGLRVGPAGAVEKTAVVRVRFADGTEAQVPGVLCPMPESWLSRNIPLFGLGACFVLFVAIARRRRRHGKPGGESADDSAPPQNT
jgi:hypothetical protein